MKQVTTEELRELSRDDVEVKLAELRQELFKLRLQSATSYQKSFPSDCKKLRRSIARALTILTEKDR